LPPVEPVWLSVEHAEAINIGVIKSGERHFVLFPEGLAASVASPRNHWLNGEHDVVVLASILCSRLAQRQWFAAANKRTAIMAAAFFLDWNGYTLRDDYTLAPQVERLAKKEISEREFAEILRTLVI
jgi:death-on-curing family protein